MNSTMAFGSSLKRSIVQTRGARGGGGRGKRERKWERMSDKGRIMGMESTRHACHLRSRVSAFPPFQSNFRCRGPYLETSRPVRFPHAYALTDLLRYTSPGSRNSLPPGTSLRARSMSSLRTAASTLATIATSSLASSRCSEKPGPMLRQLTLIPPGPS